MTSGTDVEDLVPQVRGSVLLPGDDGFAGEVAGFHLAAVHHPDLVVGADDAGDVMTAVQWAAAHHEPVGVRAAGHGADRPMEGGLLVTTHRMQEPAVDPVRRTARIGAGVRWRSVIDAIAPHGLGVLKGSSSHAGAVGYILGGGVFYPGADAPHVLSAFSRWPRPAAERLDVGGAAPEAAPLPRLPRRRAPAPPDGGAPALLLGGRPRGRRTGARAHARGLARRARHGRPDGPPGHRPRPPRRHAARPLRADGAVPAGPRRRGDRGAAAARRPGLRLPAARGGSASWAGRAFVTRHGAPGGESERARAWSEEACARVVRAKAVYDPENLLRFQHVVGQPG